MRQLGSFNRHLKPTQHRDDHKPERGPVVARRPAANGGYTLGVHRDSPPVERPTPTGSEKFASSRTRRMAGQALGMDIKRGTGLSAAFAAPMIGSAELRTPGLPQ